MHCLIDKFNGEGGDDVKDFLYTFVNVVMRGKNEE